jgi:hypothetical protein
MSSLFSARSPLPMRITICPRLLILRCRRRSALPRSPAFSYPLRYHCRPKPGYRPRTSRSLVRITMPSPLSTRTLLPIRITIPRRSSTLQSRRRPALPPRPPARSLSCTFYNIILHPLTAPDSHYNAPPVVGIATQLSCPPSPLARLAPITIPLASHTWLPPPVHVAMRYNALGLANGQPVSNSAHPSRHILTSSPIAMHPVALARRPHYNSLRRGKHIHICCTPGFVCIVMSWEVHM